MLKNNFPFQFTFDLPNLKAGHYSANYFLKAQKILVEHQVGSPTATLQFICFNSEPIMVAGIAEVVSLLQEILPTNVDIQIEGVQDGMIINKDVPILKITGPYPVFAFLENVIDGILARRSTVATNCWRVLSALRDDQTLIYMNDRNDDYRTQMGDGYAAYVAGVRHFVTAMQVAWITDPGITVGGTIPHALIQQYHNQLPKMVQDFVATTKEQPTVLLDYENDVIKALEELLPVFCQIKAVRIDTSKAMVDHNLSDPNLRGVNPTLIRLVRQWLDEHHLHKVKIVVSSGITLAQIQAWKDVPVDTYGVGSYFLNRVVTISADLVKYGSEDYAKQGRHDLPPPKEWTIYRSH